MILVLLSNHLTCLAAHSHSFGMQSTELAVFSKMWFGSHEHHSSGTQFRRGRLLSGRH